MCIASTKQKLVGKGTVVLRLVDKTIVQNREKMKQFRTSTGVMVTCKIVDFFVKYNTELKI